MTDYMKPFSHIYVEEGALQYNRTDRILEKFPGSEIIRIRDYRDIFNRRNQDPALQHKSQKLILAVKKDGFLYKGAPVCQNFGESEFYYTSNVMNCVYDCEYCFLKGMYPSSDMVVFVNLEDTFREIEEFERKINTGASDKRNIYVSVSYESDLLSIEGLTGILKDWNDWVRDRENILLELRTKCANIAALSSITDEDTGRIILAVTMSPDEVITKYEKFTPRLGARIKMAEAAREKNIPVRLCFDPMMFIQNYKPAYEKMVDIIFSKIPAESLRDVSLGSFRISKDYIKNFRKYYKNSSVAYFPYEIRDGYYQYPEELRTEMEDFLFEKLQKYLPEDKIFRWK